MSITSQFEFKIIPPSATEQYMVRDKTSFPNIDTALSMGEKEIVKNLFFSTLSQISEMIEKKKLMHRIGNQIALAIVITGLFIKNDRKLPEAERSLTEVIEGCREKTRNEIITKLDETLAGILFEWIDKQIEQADQQGGEEARRLRSFKKLLTNQIKIKRVITEPMKKLSLIGCFGETVFQPQWFIDLRKEYFAQK